MTYETALDATKFLIANAEEVNQTPSINFFGGEPMLMWDKIIVPLTNWIRKEYKKPFQLSMTTNGTLLNEERIKFMKDNGIGMLLSIDGAKETQDYNRPYHNSTSSSFDTLEKILPTVVQNFSTTFRMTTIPPTCHHVFENIKFADSLGFKSFFVIPNVFQEWPEDKKEILKNEITKYGDYYIDCMRNGK
jgi:sulfatase maturation enzyme AslB (radical SAM superfamily)